MVSDSYKNIVIQSHQYIETSRFKMKICMLVAICLFLLLQYGHCKCSDFKKENKWGKWKCKPENLKVKTECSFHSSKVDHIGSLKIACGEDGEWHNEWNGTNLIWDVIEIFFPYLVNFADFIYNIYNNNNNNNNNNNKMDLLQSQARI